MIKSHKVIHVYKHKIKGLNGKITLQKHWILFQRKTLESDYCYLIYKIFWSTLRTLSPLSIHNYITNVKSHSRSWTSFQGMLMNLLCLDFTYLLFKALFEVKVWRKYSFQIHWGLKLIGHFWCWNHFDQSDVCDLRYPSQCLTWEQFHCSCYQCPDCFMYLGRCIVSLELIMAVTVTLVLSTTFIAALMQANILLINKSLMNNLGFQTDTCT